LDYIKKNPPDLVLLDIMMPGISGYEVCQHIQQDPNLKFTKVILVSGKAMIEERLKGYDCGADDYMTKPFITEELLAKTKVFLRLTKIEKELSEMNRSLDLKVEEKVLQLMEAEAKLMNSTKMSALGEMAGGIAHEINTPLATIMLLSEQQQRMLADDKNIPPKALKAFVTITSAASHISRIVQGLRFFSRESSSDPFIKSELSKIIEDTVILCSERFKSRDIQLTIDSLPCEFFCRPVQIAQVLLNLLNNSFHAVENQKEKIIKISSTVTNHHLEVSVSDSGEAIPSAIREKMFMPFFTTKDIGKGTGLGLSISKGIIENHKGILSLDDSSTMTCFKFQIPLNPETIKVGI
jgi:C4-dicarboxylate-specific signal transduction histidine kinase